MKSIFIAIFTTIFLAVFALNINYQLKPVDKVWGLSNAVADETNNVCATGWDDLTNAIVSAVVSLLKSSNSSTKEVPIKVWNTKEVKCLVEVYRKINASASVDWQVSSNIVGFSLNGGYESKKVKGTKQQSIWVPKDGEFYRECEAMTECVPV